MADWMNKPVQSLQFVLPTVVPPNHLPSCRARATRKPVVRYMQATRCLEIHAKESLSIFSSSTSASARLVCIKHFIDWGIYADKYRQDCGWRKWTKGGSGLNWHKSTSWVSGQNKLSERSDLRGFRTRRSCASNGYWISKTESLKINLLEQ